MIDSLKSQNRTLFFIATLAFVFFASAVALRAQTTASPLPAPTGYVNDFAGVIDSATKQKLETLLTELDQQQKIQFAVVTVKTTDPQDIFNYSLAVARGWGIGDKDVQKPSLLLLVAIDDRKYHTQTSRHIEGDLPDGLVGQIQRDKLVPQFKKQQYGQGILDTITAYIAVLEEKRGFTIAGVDQSQAYHPAQDTNRSISSKSGSSCCGLGLIVVLVIFLIFVFGRGGGGRGGGCMNLFLLGSLLNSGRGGSSGWSGGGFGGSGGGGGGGFGGFGGGGDFGGGGAGGSW